MKQFFKIIMVLSLVSAPLTSCKEKKQAEKELTLLVIFDGLRPEYITPEVMPNTYKLKTEGVLASEHHSVFPTLTRVNSAAVASGAYPGTNGVMGNSVFFPAIDPTRSLNSGDINDLLRIVNHPGEKLFTSPTLAEVLKENGKKYMVFSTGSTGQSYLLNHIAEDFGAIVNPQLILPQGLRSELIKEIGPLPSSDKKNMQKHTWITDAWLHYATKENAPEVSIVWFTDPDATAHAHGVGAPETLASIKYVDNELGRILSSLEVSDMKDRVNILVGTDHGFVTHVGTNDISTFLIEEQLKDSIGSEDVVVAGGAIYVKEKSKVPEIVSALHKQHWIGGLFTAASEKDSTMGQVEGTLSLSMAKFDHSQRSPDILVDLMWNKDENSHGYPGTSFSRGIAGHGGGSPYEMQIELIGYGPAFKTGKVSTMPTANVDLAPTMLYLQGVEVPKEMEGRVLFELMEHQERAAIETAHLEVKVPGPVKTQVLKTMSSGNHWYLSSLQYDEAPQEKE